MDLRVRLASSRRRWEEMDRRLADHIRPVLAQFTPALDRLRRDLETSVRTAAERARARLQFAAGQLAQLSPLRVLDRGYAIVRDPGGRVLKDAAHAPAGTPLNIRLAHGELAAEVTESTPGGSSELPS